METVTPSFMRRVTVLVHVASRVIALKHILSLQLNTINTCSDPSTTEPHDPPTESEPQVCAAGCVMHVLEGQPWASCDLGTMAGNFAYRRYLQVRQIRQVGGLRTSVWC